MDGRQTSGGIMLLLLCWWWWRSWWTWESVTTNPVPLNKKVDNTATNTKNHDPANMATNKTVSHSTCWNWTLHIIWICNVVVAMVEQMFTKVDPVSVDLPPQVTSSSSSSSCNIDNYGYNCHRLVQSMDGVASLPFRSLSLSMIIVWQTKWSSSSSKFCNQLIETLYFVAICCKQPVNAFVYLFLSFQDRKKTRRDHPLISTRSSSSSSSAPLFKWVSRTEICISHNKLLDWHPLLLVSPSVHDPMIYYFDLLPRLLLRLVNYAIIQQFTRDDSLSSGEDQKRSIGNKLERNGWRNLIKVRGRRIREEDDVLDHPMMVSFMAKHCVCKL